MYKDLNGDGKISEGARTLGDHGDLKILGDTYSHYFFGIDLNADWKGFDFRAFFQGVLKHDYWGSGNFTGMLFGVRGGYSLKIIFVQNPPGWKGMSFPLTSIRTIHGLFSPIHPMEPASEQRIKRYRVVMCRMLPTYA